MDDARSLETLARRHLPPAVADAWIGMLRPSLHLRSAGDGEAVVGRLGGVPEVPDGFSWPEVDDHGPLTFIASIDCDRLPSAQLGMPDTGRLLFFYYDDQLPPNTVVPWEETPDCARVVYLPGGTPGTGRDQPAGIKPYRAVALTGEVRATGPYWAHPALEDAVSRMSADDQAFMADWDNGDAFMHALWELAPTPRHQIGGHAYAIQNPVETEVARAQLGGEVSYDDPALRHQAMRWQLLAQFDSDDQAEMAWGDAGTLYWLIRPEDLAARRFDAASFDWQH